MIKQFTDQEIEYLIEYTEMDKALEYDLGTTPVVYFSRSENTINFVTLFSKELNNIRTQEGPNFEA
jgi:hypothetical protein